MKDNPDRSALLCLIDVVTDAFKQFFAAIFELFRAIVLIATALVFAFIMTIIMIAFSLIAIPFKLSAEISKSKHDKDILNEWHDEQNVC